MDLKIRQNLSVHDFCRRSQNRSLSDESERKHSRDGSISLRQSHVRKREENHFERKKYERHSNETFSERASIFPETRPLRYLPLGPNQLKEDWLKYEDWLNRRKVYRAQKPFSFYSLWEESDTEEKSSHVHSSRTEKYSSSSSSSWSLSEKQVKERSSLQLSRIQDSHLKRDKNRCVLSRKDQSSSVSRTSSSSDSDSHHRKYRNRSKDTKKRRKKKHGEHSHRSHKKTNRSIEKCSTSCDSSDLHQRKKKHKKKHSRKHSKDASLLLAKKSQAENCEISIEKKLSESEAKRKEDPLEERVHLTSPCQGILETKIDPVRELISVEDKNEIVGDSKTLKQEKITVHVQKNESDISKTNEVDKDDTDEEDDMPGPKPLEANEKLSKQALNYGGALRPGEGEAMAQFVQTGQRIPRRGEVGLTASEIEAFESLGYVMSGSRHRRMNAVRIRKENQVYSAEEQRALAMYNYEERANRDSQLIADLKEMLSKQNEKFLTESMQEKIAQLKAQESLSSEQQ